MDNMIVSVVAYMLQLFVKALILISETVLAYALSSIFVSVLDISFNFHGYAIPVIFAWVVFCVKYFFILRGE